jgi:hypothetical protein
VGEMRIFDKIYIKLFTKSGDRIVSKDGHFEFKVPTGFHYKCSKGLYQIFNPIEKDFLFQWQGYVLTEEKKNEFNAELELKNEKIKNPSAVIQTTGNYDCICSATVTEDNSEIVYTWKIGERNKRILVTLLLDGLQPRDKIDEKIHFAGRLMKDLKINHVT